MHAMNGKIQEKKYTLNVSVEKPFHFQRKKKKSMEKRNMKKNTLQLQKKFGKNI